MNEPKLFEQDELAEGEEDEALMLFVNDDDTSGRWRWKNIRGFFASLHRRNPLEVVWDKTTLYAPATPVRDYDFSDTYNLDIRQGANRHSFADGYSHFIFYLTNNSSAPDRGRYPLFIDSDSILNASETSPHNFFTVLASTMRMTLTNFAFQSNTSFKLGAATGAGNEDTDSAYLAEIVGVKLIVRPSTL